MSVDGFISIKVPAFLAFTSQSPSLPHIPMTTSTREPTLLTGLLWRGRHRMRSTEARMTTKMVPTTVRRIHTS